MRSRPLPIVTIAGVAALSLLPARFSAAPNPKNGPALLNQFGCLGCHKIGAKGGAQGPDLTHVGKTWKLPALKKEIENPKARVPDSKMPSAKDLSMKPNQVADVAAYLATL